MPATAAGLQVDEIYVDYGQVRALRGLSLTAPAGQITAVLGANGAGKSTTLKTVSGLMRPRHGRVMLTRDARQVDLTGRPPHEIVRSGVVHIPEGRQMFAEMTVQQNLVLGGHTQPRRSVAAGLADVYERFPVLRERRNQATGTLSGGEQQMVAIGRGLMGRPQVLLLDEPSLGLAPLVVREILLSIAQLCRQDGLTILLVEQNIQQALAIAEHAYVIASGAVTLHGTSEELLHDPNIRSSYLGGA